MQHTEKPSGLVRYGGTLWFISMSAGALIWFIFDAVRLTEQLSGLTEAISFNKGIFYLPGVGIGLGALSFAAIYQYWLNRPLTEQISRLITKLAVSGLLITFLLPNITHYFINNYLTTHGYEVCQHASHQWLHSRIIVFTSSTEACSAL
jgi:hypothetical protein